MVKSAILKAAESFKRQLMEPKGIHNVPVRSTPAGGKTLNSWSRMDPVLSSSQTQPRTSSNPLVNVIFMRSCAAKPLMAGGINIASSHAFPRQN